MDDRLYFFGSRPFAFNAWRRANSICALTLRRSSAAHRSRAACTSGEMRSANALRLGTIDLVERASVEDRGGLALAGEHDQQVGNHLSLALVVELDDIALAQ